MRKAEIYLYNRFAGILIEDENGYFVNKLVDLVDQINDNKTLRNIIWMICEYAKQNIK